MTDDLRSALTETGDAIRAARDEMAGIGDDIAELEAECEQWRQRAEQAELDAKATKIALLSVNELNLKLIEQAKEQAATIERAVELRDKWLKWPKDDPHYGAGLMLAQYLDLPMEAT